MRQSRGKWIKRLLCFAFVCFFITGLFCQTYDAKAAANYAYKWYKKFNPKYNDYSCSDPDEDANFVSQALIAGNMTFKGSPFIDGKGCLVVRSALHDYLWMELFTKVSPWKDKVPDYLTAGDVVFFGKDESSFKLVGMVAGYNPVGDVLEIVFHYTECDETRNTSLNMKGLDELILVYGGATFHHFE